jgi:hypothetical protein
MKNSKLYSIPLVAMAMLFIGCEPLATEPSAADNKEEIKDVVEDVKDSIEVKDSLEVKDEPKEITLPLWDGGCDANENDYARFSFPWWYEAECKLTLPEGTEVESKEDKEEPIVEPIICTAQYEPVCGMKDSGLLYTFGNECELGVYGATFKYDGECEKETTSPKPVYEGECTATGEIPEGFSKPDWWIEECLLIVDPIEKSVTPTEPTLLKWEKGCDANENDYTTYSFPYWYEKECGVELPTGTVVYQ